MQRDILAENALDKSEEAPETGHTTEHRQLAQMCEERGEPTNLHPLTTSVYSCQPAQSARLLSSLTAEIRCLLRGIAEDPFRKRSHTSTDVFTPHAGAQGRGVCGIEPRSPQQDSGDHEGGAHAVTLQQNHLQIQDLATPHRPRDRGWGTGASEAASPPAASCSLES